MRGSNDLYDLRTNSADIDVRRLTVNLNIL